MTDKQMFDRLKNLTKKPDEVIEFGGINMDQMSKPTLMMFVRWLIEYFEQDGNESEGPESGS